MKVKLSRDDIVLGMPIPWTLYNEQGVPLFRKGIVINNSESLGKLLRMDLYHDQVETGIPTQEQLTENSKPSIAADHTDSVSATVTRDDPFTKIDCLALSIKKNFDYWATEKQIDLHAIMRLAEETRILYDTHPEESLAAVHLSYNHPYSCLQPLYSAILCEMIAQDQNYSLQRRRSLVAAALTANIGMYKYYDQLNNQGAALNEYQKNMIRAHPEESCRILQKIGLNDILWLSIVEQHHERTDGSGYPKGLTKGQIQSEAILVSIVDFYLSLIMPRAYRDPVLSRDALQRIYRNASEDDRIIITGFIKLLGIYPPGTFVKLSNDEIAIVTRRSHKSATHPKVVSIGTINSMENFAPQVRDTMNSNITIDEPYLFDIRHPIDTNYIWSLK